MKVRKITESVIYVGVNDRTTTRFEALWPLPYGVSYNSYVVRGSRATALIDSVEGNEFRSLIDNFCDLGEFCSPDFLVVNHTEPDHSGSIPLLLDRFPGLSLVCNKISAEQVKGFYHVPDERIFVVKDGDTLDLGGRTLRFVTTPMVHWPETMMTYLEEERVLFSGDAFGCFGALNGRFTDREMSSAELEVYFSEMNRYYSCIVGKYGKFVQAAMKKAGSLPIDYICSTHGPVWIDEKKRVLDVYDRLSRYEAEGGTVIVFATMYGNTAELVDRIADALAGRGMENIRIFNAATAEMCDMITEAFLSKTLIVGSPTYSMDVFPPVQQFMNAMRVREIKNKVTATFGSFTWASAAGASLEKQFEVMGLPPVAQLSMKHAYSDGLEPAIAEFAEKVAAASK